MDVYIQHNGVTIWSSLDFTTDQFFSLSPTVAVGDTIDWLVTGGYGWGNTPLDAKVTYDPGVIPEASSWVLFGLGALGMMVWRRRKQQ